MKTRLLSVFVFAFLLLAGTTAQAQDFPKMDKSPMDAASYPSSYKESNKVVKVVYSRPQLKGRSLSKLAPNGKVWRTGANEAPEITFYKDVNFGDGIVKAGTYALFAIPGDSEWTVILNSDLNTWGSYFYKEENDIARVKVAVNKGDESVEAFSIMFDDNGTMHMGWGTARVAVPIK